MIVAEDLTKQFDDILAVDGLFLTVEPGQVLILLGPNGAGKTTSVRMLTSVLLPTRGKATVAGFNVVSQADQVRASVGVLTEHHGLYGRMTALEYLDFFGRLYRMDSRHLGHRIDELLVQFGLGTVRNRRLGEYSKGMRQKLALVRALLHDPPVLLLDEPTSAMDPESAHMVRDAIQRLRSADRTIILCTHNLVEAEELADRVAIICKGRIIRNEAIQELKTNLLGPLEFEIRFTNHMNGWVPDWPAGASLTAKGDTWLRFQTTDPAASNPVVLRQVLSQNLQVVYLQEVPRSLEQAYLIAVGQAEGTQRDA